MQLEGQLISNTDSDEGSPLSKSQKKREKMRARKRKLAEMMQGDAVPAASINNNLKATTPKFLTGEYWDKPLPIGHPVRTEKKPKPKMTPCIEHTEPECLNTDGTKPKRRKKKKEEPVLILEKKVDYERRIKKEKADKLLANIPIPEETNTSILRTTSLPSSPKSRKTATFVDGLVLTPEELAIRNNRAEHLRSIPNVRNRAIQAEVLNEQDKRRENPDYDMKSKDLDENGKTKRSRFTSMEFKFLEDLPSETRQQKFELKPKRKKQYKNKKPQRKQLAQKTKEPYKKPSPSSSSSEPDNQISISQSVKRRLLCKVATSGPLLIDVDAINRLTDARDARLAAAKANKSASSQVEAGQTRLVDLPIYKSMTRPFLVETVDLVTLGKQADAYQSDIIDVD